MVRSAIAASRQPSRWTALALIVAAQFMVILDVSIVNVALATIKSDLHFSQTSLQWVITSYAIVFGGFLLLGGVLTSYLSWPWIFFINVPVGAAIVLLAPRFLSESSAMLSHRHFDVAGATTVTASLMVLVYALTRATQEGWSSATTVGLLAVSALLAALFGGIERRAANPLLSIRVFRGNRLALAALITAIIASIA